MNENAIISIKSSQMSEGEKPDTIELVTGGTLLKEEGGYTIVYQESELTGLEGTTTRLRVEDGRVVLLREGNVNSQMIFEEGEKHLSMYETPYGALAVGIDTRRVSSSIGDAGGEVRIHYDIEIDNLLAGRTLFRLNVKRKEPQNNPVLPQ